MSSKTLFVTGGTGYIGGALIEIALAKGYNVRCPQTIPSPTPLT